MYYFFWYKYRLNCDYSHLRSIKPCVSVCVCVGVCRCVYVSSRFYIYLFVFHLTLSTSAIRATYVRYQDAE